MRVDPIFSQEDADLSLLKWRVTGKRKWRYPKRGHKKLQHAHRIVLSRIVGRALTPVDICDHINGNTLDCRRKNLRLTNFKGNAQNRDHGKFRNTTWHKAFARWQSHITVNRKCLYLGLFDSREEAAEAAAKARIEHKFLERIAQ